MRHVPLTNKYSEYNPNRLKYSFLAEVDKLISSGLMKAARRQRQISDFSFNPSQILLTHLYGARILPTIPL